MNAGAVSNIIVNAHGEGIGLLEHHTHPTAQQVHIHIAVNVLPVQGHFALDVAALHQVVHPVQGL